MHNDGRTELDLADFAQLHGISKSRYQQGLRCRAREIAGAYTRDYEKETHAGHDDPRRRPKTHTPERYGDAFLCDCAVSPSAMHIEAHQSRDQRYQEQKIGRASS